jgi:hypothetical protein
VKHLRLEFNPKLNDGIFFINWIHNNITDILLGFEVDSCIIAGMGISQDDLTKQVEGKKFKYFAKKMTFDFQNSIHLNIRKK